MINLLFSKQFAKLLLISVFIFSYKVSSGFQQQQSTGLSKTDTAFVPKEIEDPENIGINKEASHATLMPYATLKEALAANRHASSFSRSLNGLWKFNWVDWPQKRPVNFYKTDYDVSGWKDIKVPSNWQVEGYGTPYYSNYTYIFQKDFPRVMSTPPVKYTAYKERNPVGSYRRDFTVPAEWSGRRIFITFDGVDAGFFIWVNGKKVGYSVNSRNAAEFDLTKYLQPGKNTLAVEVYRFTTGSYLEDQDMWRLSGIFRNVTLWSAPQEHIRDYFIKTNLDKQFKNADLVVSTQVKNYGTIAVKARELNIALFNGNVAVPGAATKKTIPALQPGQEVVVEASVHVANPQKWTAETPKLYTTVVKINDGGNTVETISSRTGFRNIEIKGRLFLVNGVPIKLKGVNRHENWPNDGHAVTEAQMISDILLIKQANCNHVRTCHYSDDPRWYEQCDEYGIYLVAEANLESHGAWDEFNEEPRIKAALIDRNVANVENFKNHPSVIIWSLGNECGSGGSNFRAILKVIGDIDPTRPRHYQGFGIGNNNPADMDSEMYTDVESLEKHANDKTLTKPFYLCEYAHAMFNSMGSVDIYNDLFDKYPQLLGGAIWEWQDQGIYNNRDPKHPITAFGGGFGEYPNDQYFIHKGVVFSDRSPKPHYPELKHAYQWISIKAKDLKNGVVTIKNRYQFINLNGFTAKWDLSEDGKVLSAGSLAVGLINPGGEKDIKIPFKVNPKPGAEYFLRVSFDLATDKLWAKKGFEVASQQLQLPVAIPFVEDKAKGDALTLNDSKDEIKVAGTGFRLRFDKAKGTFTKMEKDGEDLIKQNGGPMLHLWRAPHRKDDMWAYEDWEKNGLKDLTWVATDVKSIQIAANIIEIKASLTGTGKNNFVVNHKVVYTINGKGEIKVDNDVTFSDPKLILARIGVRMFLNKELDQFDYLGRGPMENYGDRKSGFDVGHYSSTVNKQLTPYEKPMECGNHEDVRWANVTSAKGLGISIKKGDALLQVAALPYSDEEMTDVEYKIDLPKSSGTVLCISHKTLGVGSWGCGPRPLEPYLVYAKPTTFSYQIQLLKKK
ncbi:glycoside hydrolase family 2 TIM barrel-domain containing protein [Mucilaginibacter sp. FT3.2]|uniref:glycoside hydrolase family 2 TIM barrel-domain containing protein n=1 Tax=Mucilaginibacter sp. FT3.2 TaxID=2723090 RepID=UPI00161E6C2C|nr:glycoside hydrolase family 2 TIM barrel-domain containing protein [Mucilaginibacter sp. FT3.2]MBB6235240.1 beta-galactosidase [Mucilaginibacter sp. FT3.2]